MLDSCGRPSRANGGQHPGVAPGDEIDQTLLVCGRMKVSGRWRGHASVNATDDLRSSRPAAATRTGLGQTGRPAGRGSNR